MDEEASKSESGQCQPRGAMVARNNGGTGAATAIVYVDEAADARASSDDEEAGDKTFERSGSPAEQDKRRARAVVSGCLVEMSDLRESQTERSSGEHAEWALKSSSDATQVGRELAKLAAEIERNFGDAIDDLVDQVPSDAGVAYTTIRMALEGFLGSKSSASAGPSPSMMSRILTVLVFGFRWATRYATSYSIIGLIVHYIARYLVEVGLVAWMQEQGSWLSSLVTSNTTPAVRYGGAAALVALAAFVFWRWSRQ